MNRRQFVAAAGALSLPTLAGCLSGDGEYRTVAEAGHEVPLVPIGDAYEWHQGDEAEFLDARSRREYMRAHIEGAHSSPPRSPDHDHPTDDWPADVRIVTYCPCPHTLAVARAGELYEEGFEDVYALDEGFNAWVERDYPLEGAAVSQSIPEYHIEGRTDAAHAGADVWLEEPVTEQRYRTYVDDDGSYEMTFAFVDVDDDTVLELELPDRTIERPLGELTDGVVTA